MMGGVYILRAELGGWGGFEGGRVLNLEGGTCGWGRGFKDGAVFKFTRWSLDIMKFSYGGW